MTGPVTSVTREGMLKAADRMSQTLSTVQTECGQVQSSVTYLKHSFGGDAAISFTRAMSQWDNNAQEIVSALSEMIRIMQDGAEQVRAGAANTTDIAEEGAMRMANANPGLAGLGA